MTGAEALPVWLAVAIGICLVAGSALTLVGCIGLVRLRTFYQRVHAPTLGATGGLILILLASVLHSTARTGVLSVHEILIAIFLTVTTPVALILLVQATQDRRGDDRSNRF